MTDTKHDDGGPAFPLPKSAFPAITEKPPQVAGMTLLDYFAGQALAGLIRTGAIPEASGPDVGEGESLLSFYRTCGGNIPHLLLNGDPVTVPELLADEAYDCAAAMIAEKRRREGSKQ
jgi:hypothetical protein